MRIICIRRLRSHYLRHIPSINATQGDFRAPEDPDQRRRIDQVLVESCGENASHNAKYHV